MASNLSGGSPREGARSEERAEQRLAAGGPQGSPDPELVYLPPGIGRKTTPINRASEATVGAVTLGGYVQADQHQQDREGEAELWHGSRLNVERLCGEGRCGHSCGQ
jgi:hypothetical protein